MKCPLMLMAWQATETKKKFEPIECLKEECAWWSEELGQCDPTGMLPHIITLGNALDQLVDKMPHEEQFRR